MYKKSPPIMPWLSPEMDTSPKWRETEPDDLGDEAQLALLAVAEDATGPDAGFSQGAIQAANIALKESGDAILHGVFSARDDAKIAGQIDNSVLPVRLDKPMPDPRLEPTDD